MKNDIKNISKAIVLGLVLSVGVGYLSAAWTEPSAAPTGGNTDAPLNIGAGTQTKGTTANGGAGSLTLTGALTTNIFKLLDATPTDDAGKILVSDANGIGTWQSTSTLGITGGGSSSGSLFCKNVDTAVPPTGQDNGVRGESVIGTYVINLVKSDGVNMCSDENGCSIRLWAFDTNYPQGRYYFTTSPVMVRQVSDGRFLVSYKDITGTNGDNTQTVMTEDDTAGVGWKGGYLKDDIGIKDSSKNFYSFIDDSTSLSFSLQICDF